jgi:hypothetical protein
MGGTKDGRRMKPKIRSGSDCIMRLLDSEKS